MEKFLIVMVILFCGVANATIDDVLYFKVDDSNRPDYKAAGTEPFTFTYDKGQVVMSYYEVPVEVLENKENTSQWALKALEVAQAAKKSKRKPA